ncbi:MAG: AAA family ATPase [Chthoniobacteraceae bacterium]
MKLHSVLIKKFRSAEEVMLQDIGELNVLIGKNNSGKSNVLFAINSFFACIKGGSLVNPEPPVGSDIDYFARSVIAPIEFELAFLMSEQDRDELVQDIVSAAPQMKNAAESIAKGMLLAIRVAVVKRPRQAAFVSDVSLRHCSEPTKKIVNLLSVPDEAAVELVGKAVETGLATAQAADLEKFIGRFENDDWERLKSRSREGGMPLRMYLRGNLGDSRTHEVLETFVRRAESYSDLRGAIESHIAASRDAAEKVLREDLKTKLGTFAGEETEIPEYVQKLIRRIASTKVLYLKERRSPIGEEEAKRLLSLKVQRGGTQVLQNIQETVAALLGVRIDAFNSTSVGKEAEIDVDEFLADVNGSGVREALRLVLDFEFQKPDLFLVEEPEIYLHPALETSMMRYLKTISSTAQIFITTHSTNFLDTAEMKNVYLVSKTKSTQVQKLNFEEAETQIPHELGIRLSSLFLFDRLVFVEGPSDEAVLREWAAKLRINFSQVGVGFVHMGGVHNFGYFAAEQTMTFLTKRKVKLWFLLDRDEKEEVEIANLARKCGANASLKVLKRREIENYFVLPRVITEFIALKRSLAGGKTAEGTLTEAEVLKKVDEIAETLKGYTIEKRVARALSSPVYPIARRVFEAGKPLGAAKLAEEIGKGIDELAKAQKDVERVYAEQTNAIESAWNQSKLSLVAGDLLLDGVCQAFGVRFRKEADSSRAAALLKTEEIDGEIRDILLEIGKP